MTAIGTTKKYAICRHGYKITVKRTDRDHDFGDILTYRDTLPEARLCAKVERMVIKRFIPQHGQSNFAREIGGREL